MEFLITGCGRSGTKYIAERLTSSGASCGHEKIFTVYGPVKDSFDDFGGDSSWFAAPFLQILPPALPVLHIVRNPAKVVKSFYRIGLCSRYLWRQFSMGRSLLGTIIHYNFRMNRIIQRYNYVKAHRRLLQDYTSCMTEANEIDRLWAYWYQWNRLVEEKSAQFELNYLRVPLERVDQLWPEIADFLKLESTPTPGTPANQKSKRRRRPRSLTLPPQEVVDLASKYGYRDIIQEVHEY